MSNEFEAYLQVKVIKKISKSLTSSPKLKQSSHLQYNKARGRSPVDGRYTKVKHLKPARPITSQRTFSIIKQEGRIEP